MFYLNKAELDNIALARAMMRKRVTSVEELAALAGVKAAKIGGGFWGETDLDVILKLADALECAPESLVRDEGRRRK